jgi:hypothetical protein
MAKTFGNTKGAAQKSKFPTYQYKDGEQKLRLFGGVLPRYMYWIKSSNGKDIPLECLSFDRDEEKFTNVEKDVVPSYFPDLKCSWSYAVNALTVDNEPVVVNLKKKLFQQIMDAAESLGDPTDPDTGWWIVFKRAKTGSMAYNVEYTLQVLKCKSSALTDEQREIISKEKSIDEKFPRPTPEEIEKAIQRLTKDDDEGDAEGQATPEEAKDL